jgi:hypothetical protein
VSDWIPTYNTTNKLRERLKHVMAGYTKYIYYLDHSFIQMFLNIVENIVGQRDRASQAFRQGRVTMSR